MTKRHVVGVVNVLIIRVGFLQFAESLIGYSNDVMFPKKSREEPDMPSATAVTETPKITLSHTRGVKPTTAETTLTPTRYTNIGQN